MKKFLFLLLLPFVLFSQNNYAIDFESTNSQYIIEGTTTWGSTVTQGHISFWIKPESVSGNITLFSLASTSNNFDRFLVQIRSGYIATNSWYNGGGGNYTLVTSTTTEITAGNIYFITISKGSTKHRIWVNNIEQTTVVSVTDHAQKNMWFSTLSDIDFVTIGAYYIGTTPNVGGYFDGVMDEFNFFNNLADQTIVEGEYNSGIPKDLSNNTGWYGSVRMEEGTGTSTTSTDGLVFDFTNTPVWIASPFGWYSGDTGQDKGFKEYNKRIICKTRKNR